MRLPARRRGRAKTPWVRGRREQEGQNRMGRGRGLWGPRDPNFRLQTSSPVIRGRIEEGAGPTRNVGPFQIKESERSPEWLSPSCILPRKTGEEMRGKAAKPA